MRLIDADQFKAKLLSFMDRKATTPSDTDCILDGVLNLLEEQPTETSESWVKHGHWIFVKDVVAYIKDMVSYIKCSECGGDICWVNTKRPKYCPSCGAKMEVNTND